jgi:hypothetical protein
MDFMEIKMMMMMMMMSEFNITCINKVTGQPSSSETGRLWYQ